MISSRATFLTPKEKDEVARRLRSDAGHIANTDFSLKYAWQAIKDWKIYIHMLIGVGGFCPIYSFALFLPTIVKNMGYTANNAQLMTVPPYVCATIFTIGLNYAADRFRQRGVFLLGCQVIAITGFALLAGSGKPSVQYAGTVLAAIGIYPQIPLGLAWNSGNMGGTMKRGVGIAMQVMGMNTGGIISSYVYLSRDGPRYVKGHSILIGFVGLAFFMTLFMTLWCRRENARRDDIDDRPVGAELTEAQREMERDMADNVPWFRYTV
jgi:hypothetical protein